MLLQNFKKAIIAMAGICVAAVCGQLSASADASEFFSEEETPISGAYRVVEETTSTPVWMDYTGKLHEGDWAPLSYDSVMAVGAMTPDGSVQLVDAHPAFMSEDAAEDGFIGWDADETSEAETKVEAEIGISSEVNKTSEEIPEEPTPEPPVPEEPTPEPPVPEEPTPEPPVPEKPTPEPPAPEEPTPEPPAPEPSAPELPPEEPPVPPPGVDPS